MDKDLILFDFDGTVINNSEGIFNCIGYSLDKLGLPHPSKETLNKFIGPSLFESFKEHCCDDEEKATLFVEYYRERFAPTGCLECVLYDGITDAVKKIKDRGRTVAVCSSKPLEFVKKIARNLEIFELFDEFFCPDFASHTSDKTYLINEAIKHYGTTKEKTLIVGDTQFDIIAAKNAGVTSIGVRYGFAAPGELEKAGADHIVSTVYEISDLILGE